MQRENQKAAAPVINQTLSNINNKDGEVWHDVRTNRERKGLKN